MVKFHSYFHIEIVEDFNTFLTLQEQWNQLLTTIPQYLPSMTWEWHYAWLLANPAYQHHLHVILVYNHNRQLVGIIPLIKRVGHLAWVPLKMLTLAGNRDHIKTIFIASPEHQLPLLDALMHYLTHDYPHWDILAFRRLGSNRADEIFLERISKHLHLRFSTEATIEIPYIALPDNWDTYWKARSKHFRHEYRRKMRKLQQQGKVTIRMIEPPLPQRAFQQFVELENSGWKGKQRSSLAHRPHLLELYRQAAQLSSPYFRMLLFELRLDNRLIAASLCPQTRDGLFVYKIAYDESMARYSPGILLRVAEIQYAIQHQLAIYSFSGKAQPWMWQFTHRKHFTRDVIIYHHSLPARLRHIGYTVARPFLKRLPLLPRILHRLVKDA